MERSINKLETKSGKCISQLIITWSTASISNNSFPSNISSLVLNLTLLTFVSCNKVLFRKNHFTKILFSLSLSFSFVVVISFLEQIPERNMNLVAWPELSLFYILFLADFVNSLSPRFECWKCARKILESKHVLTFSSNAERRKNAGN